MCAILEIDEMNISKSWSFCTGILLLRKQNMRTPCIQQSVAGGMTYEEKELFAAGAYDILRNAPGSFFRDGGICFGR